MSPQTPSIFLEEAEILAHQGFAEGQYLLRLHAPRCAARAQPGSFVHLQVDPQRPMRRPLSLMRASADEGWVEMLYKVVGEGTELLADQAVGKILSSLGPIGQGFTPHPQRPRPLLIGGGVGIPPMIFLAEQLRQQQDWQPLVLMGSEIPFPFKVTPSRFLLEGLPAPAIAGMALLEDWGIPSRLASLHDWPGCHSGYVTELAGHWLEALEPQARQQVELFACGPHPMLEAVARLARRFELPCQVSLEEFMACGVGGCAGCTVEVQTDRGPAMQRVCVDGPVFEADQVFPA